MLNKKVKMESNDLDNNKFKDFVDIFNNKLNIKMKETETDDIIDDINKLNISKEYIYIYIHSYNVCNPTKYEKDRHYINNTGILTNKNNHIYYSTKQIINKKYIKCINKIKVNNNYYKLVYLKNRYNFTDSGMNWLDNMYFYNLYNYVNNNFIDCVMTNNSIKRKVIIIKNEKIHSKLSLIQIYSNMNKNFKKIFL